MVTVRNAGTIAHGCGLLASLMCLAIPALSHAQAGPLPAEYAPREAPRRSAMAPVGSGCSTREVGCGPAPAAPHPAEQQQNAAPHGVSPTLSDGENALPASLHEVREWLHTLEAMAVALRAEIEALDPPSYDEEFEARWLQCIAAQATLVDLEREIDVQAGIVQDLESHAQEAGVQERAGPVILEAAVAGSDAPASAPPFDAETTSGGDPRAGNFEPTPDQSDRAIGPTSQLPPSDDHSSSWSATPSEAHHQADDLARVSRRASYRQLGGSLVLGWLDTASRELVEDQRRNVFSSLRLDFRDSVIDPAFINYRVQPLLSTGFQDAFTGVSGGSGVAVDVGFLSARPWSSRFRYSRFNRTMLSGGLSPRYARLTADNDDSLLGFQWQLTLPTLPTVDFNVSRSAVATRPEDVLEQGSASKSRLLSLNVKDTVGKWSVNGGFDRQHLDTEFLTASPRVPLALDTTNELGTATLQIRGPLAKRVMFSAGANRTSNRSEFAGGLFLQDFDTYDARLEYSSPARLRVWTQARVTQSDLESRSSELVEGPVFVLPRTSVSNRIWDTESKYRLLRDLSVVGRFQYTRVSTPGTGDHQAGDFVNSGGGVQYSRDSRRLQLAGSYFVNRYLTRFAADAESDQLGHSLDTNIGVGDPALIRASAGYSLSRSREDVRTFLPVRSDSERVRFGLDKALRRGWKVDAHWDRTTTRYDRESLRSNYHGTSVGAAIGGGGIHLALDRAYGSGDSFQPFLDTVGTPVPIAPLLLALGSSNRSTTASAGWRVRPALFVRAAWRDQKQSIANSFASQVEQRDLAVTWRFRQLDVELGYLLYRFDFGSLAFRRSLFVRVTRGFRLLDGFGS